MKRIVKLTESDLTRIVRRVLSESEDSITKGDSSKIIYSDFKRVKPFKGGNPRDGYSLPERDILYNRCLGANRKIKLASENEDLSEEERDKNKQAWKNVIRECKFDSYYKMGILPYYDIIYGYYKRNNGKEQEYVLASLDEPYTDGSVIDMNSSIIYNCNTEEIEYKGSFQPTAPDYSADFDINNSAQQERDKEWLNFYCNSIDWNSRVGKKNNLFRDVLDISHKAYDRPFK